MVRVCGVPLRTVQQFLGFTAGGREFNVLGFVLFVFSFFVQTSQLPTFINFQPSSTSNQHQPPTFININVINFQPSATSNQHQLPTFININVINLQPSSASNQHSSTSMSSTSWHHPIVGYPPIYASLISSNLEQFSTTTSKGLRLAATAAKVKVRLTLSCSKHQADLG